MPEYDIHERATGLFAPDTLLATQYFDRIRRRKDLTGEQRLMIAVFEQAVEEYMKYVAARDRDRRELFAAAERWIESDERSWLYSFGTICDHLGFDCDYLRRGLRAWKTRARGEAPTAAPASETADSPERQRASNE